MNNKDTLLTVVLAVLKCYAVREIEQANIKRKRKKEASADYWRGYEDAFRLTENKIDEMADEFIPKDEEG